jgi:hypothetical protein
MTGMRRGPSGKLLTGLAKDDVLVWSSALREWTPAALANLMPGAPIYNVLAPPFNAANTLNGDDTNAVASAILAANAAPGVIYLGSRHRFAGDLPALANNNISVVGRGPFNGGTICQFDNGSTSPGFRATNCQYSCFANLWIVGAKAFAGSWGIRLSECFRPTVQNVVISNMGSGVDVDRCTITQLERVNLSDLYGPYGHYAHGAAGVYNHAVKYRDCTVGTSYPLSVTGVARAWTQSTLYAAGNLAIANGNIYQCLVGGTSAGSGTGPSGLPTTNISTLRTTAITDGSAQWVFAMPASPAYKMGSYAHTFEVLDCGALQFDTGLLIEDDAPGSGSVPQFCRSYNLQIDHSMRGIRVLSGGAHRFHQLFVTSCMEGNGVEIASTIDGNWEFEGGEIFGCNRAGMTIGKGDGLIQGLQIGAVSGVASNTRDCIEVGPGVTDFTIANCSLGRMYASTSPSSRYGASIAAGCDRFIVANNRAVGNLTDGFLNTPGISSTRIFNGNIGGIS